MNRHHLLVLVFLAVLPAAGVAPTAPALASHPAADVDVAIVSPHGWEFPVYPVRSESRDVRRAYLEARNQEPYRIRVSNRSGERVGLVQIVLAGVRHLEGCYRSELIPGST